MKTRLMCYHMGSIYFFPVLIFVLGMGIAQPTVAGEEIRDPIEHFFHQGFGDLPDELATAREEGKIGLFIIHVRQ